jgi:methyl-accepting chemotaxis protein
VASEVRSLAGRSAEAAKEIKGLISASVERVAHGTALVEQSAAAAQSMKVQAQQLVQAVAAFKLDQRESL